eukprot:6491823-Amphidinium_carterae.1
MWRNQRREDGHKRFGIHLLEEGRQQNGAYPVLCLAQRNGFHRVVQPECPLSALNLATERNEGGQCFGQRWVRHENPKCFRSVSHLISSPLSSKESHRLHSGCFSVKMGPGSGIAAIILWGNITRRKQGPEVSLNLWRAVMDARGMQHLHASEHSAASGLPAGAQRAEVAKAAELRWISPEPPSPDICPAVATVLSAG